MAIEYIVEVAQLAPRACVGCGGNIGPFVDVAEVEIPTANGPVPWHVYLCKRVCARSVARLCGFSAGKKLDELANAAERLQEAEKEIAITNERLAQADEERRFIERARTTAEEERDHLQGRVKQLEGVIGEKARADLALVGGDAA